MADFQSTKIQDAGTDLKDKHNALVDAVEGFLNTSDFNDVTADTLSVAGQIIGQDVGGGVLDLRRNDTEVQSPNALGQILFSGNDTGTGFRNMARIACRASSNHSPTDWSSHMRFQVTKPGETSESEAMRINSDLLVRFYNGITFDGVNSLSSLEYGTFTPIVSDATTGGNTASGSFIGYTLKYGTLVFCCVVLSDINTSGMNGSNVFYIQNMPYSCKTSISGSLSASAITYTGQIAPKMFSNNDHMTIRRTSSGSTQGSLSVSAISSGVSDLDATMIYLTDE